MGYRIKYFFDTPALRYIRMEGMNIAVTYHGKMSFANYNTYMCKLHNGVREPVPFISIADRWNNWNLQLSGMFVDVMRYSGAIVYDDVVEDFLSQYSPMGSDLTFDVCCWLLKSEIGMKDVFDRDTYDLLYEMWLCSRNDSFYVLNGEPISYRSLAQICVDDGTFEDLSIRYLKDDSPVIINNL